ncbi:DUF4169 family protein [Phenylobacterium sp.]|uniref:DUF4169 family protein n=1 Tax=Phenylobacterium sp. TaxID=1871053 RepID=UPI0035B331CE
MSEIINLNKARKAKARAEAMAQAAENRVRHGRAKAQKVQTRAEIAKLERRLDDARRED